VTRSGDTVVPPLSDAAWVVSARLMPAAKGMREMRRLKDGCFAAATPTRSRSIDGIRVAIGAAVDHSRPYGIQHEA
jgi:hypothetical protein